MFVCARASMSVSAHGGGRNLKRREGSVQGDIEMNMNTKLRRYQRRAKGTGKRINGIGVHAQG